MWYRNSDSVRCLCWRKGCLCVDLLFTKLILILDTRSDCVELTPMAKVAEQIMRVDILLLVMYTHAVFSGQWVRECCHRPAAENGGCCPSCTQGWYYHFRVDGVCFEWSWKSTNKCFIHVDILDCLRECFVPWYMQEINIWQVLSSIWIWCIVNESMLCCMQASDGFMFPNQLDLFIAGAGPSFVDPNVSLLINET